MKLVGKLLLLLAVPALHTLGIFYLYRGRHLGQAFCDSDAVVFLLPSALACAAYLAILAWIRRSAVLAIPIGIAATLLSFWMAMLVAINTYGS